MKKINKIVLTTGLLACSYSAYGFADLQLGLGFSSYEYANHSQPSALGGNFQGSLLLSMLGPDSILSVVAGPRFKYDYVTLNSTQVTVPNYNYTYTNSQNLGTFQLGGEAGLRIHAIPLFTLYTTGFATYGIYNRLTNEVRDSSGNVSTSDVGVPVSGFWQAGFSAKGMASIVPFVSVGGGFEIFTGSYMMGNYNVNTTSGYSSVSSTQYDYTGFSVNLLASISF